MVNTVLLSFLTLVSFDARAASDADIATASGLEIYDMSLEQQRHKCRDLQVGEKRKVLEPAPYKSTAARYGYFSGYDVTRVSEKKYKVHFPVVFISGKTHTDPSLEKLNTPAEIDLKTDQDHRGRVQKCLSSKNHLLKDKNGTQLELSIDNSYSEARKNSGVVHTIQIEGTQHRSNSYNYAQNIDCPTIIHELLHLAGLCDEYQEYDQITGALKNAKGSVIDPQKLGFNVKPEITTKKYDCRASPKLNTAMSDANTALSVTHPQRGWCSCNESECTLDSDYKLKFKDGYAITSSPIECPPGYEKSQLNKAEGAFFGVAPENLHYLKNLPPKMLFYLGPAKTLTPLAPAHIRHIVSPGCIEKNRKYYRCSSLAYESSVENGCGSQTRDCLKDDSWLD